MRAMQEENESALWPARVGRPAMGCSPSDDDARNIRIDRASGSRSEKSCPDASERSDWRISSNHAGLPDRGIVTAARARKGDGGSRRALDSAAPRANEGVIMVSPAAMDARRNGSPRDGSGACLGARAM